MTKPTKEEMRERLGFLVAFYANKTGKGTVKDFETDSAIRSIIEKYGDGGPMVTKDNLMGLADLIIFRLKDRRGFRQLFNGIDKETMDEIKKDMSKTIRDFNQDIGVSVEEEP